LKKNRSQYKNSFAKDKYDRVSVLLKKGDKAKLASAIKSLGLGESISSVLAAYASELIARNETQQSVTTREAAELLGISPGAVRGAVSRGQLTRPDEESGKVLLSSVIQRAETTGLDISEKLGKMKN